MCDSEYKSLVELEFSEIVDICQSYVRHIPPPTGGEVLKALPIKSLTTGKSRDILTYRQNILHFVLNLCTCVDKIFLTKCSRWAVLGILTPVFKRKCSNWDAKNYHGRTFTPTIYKILESIIRERIKHFVTENQNPLQRGFKKGSSPMNCSLILQEYIRNNKDSKMLTYIAFLDAKSAFDVVSHTSLLRKYIT